MKNMIFHDCAVNLRDGYEPAEMVNDEENGCCKDKPFIVISKDNVLEAH